MKTARLPGLEGGLLHFQRMVLREDCDERGQKRQPGSDMLD